MDNGLCHERTANRVQRKENERIMVGIEVNFHYCRRGMLFILRI